MSIIDTSYFTADEIIKRLNDNPTGYFARAERAYCSWLEEEGVDVPDTMPTADQVSNIVIEALVEYVSMLVAKDLMGYTYRQVADGVEEDPWEVKYEKFKKSFNTARVRMTYDILSNRKISKGTASGQYFRS